MHDINTKYKGLVNDVVTQLRINMTSIQTEIRYIISDKCSSMIVHNETSEKVYLD